MSEGKKTCQLYTLADHLIPRNMAKKIRSHTRAKQPTRSGLKLPMCSIPSEMAQASNLKIENFTILIYCKIGCSVHEKQEGGDKIF